MLLSVTDNVDGQRHDEYYMIRDDLGLGINPELLGAGGGTRTHTFLRTRAPKARAAAISPRPQGSDPTSSPSEAPVMFDYTSP